MMSEQLNNVEQVFNMNSKQLSNAERLCTMAFQIFHFFVLLPGEIRNKIWDFAALTHRDVDIVLVRRIIDGSKVWCFTSPTPVHPLLHTSREARYEVLKFFISVTPGKPRNAARDLILVYHTPLPAAPPPAPAAIAPPPTSGSGPAAGNTDASGQAGTAESGTPQAAGTSDTLAESSKIIVKSKPRTGGQKYYINTASERYVIRVDSSAAESVAADPSINQGDVHPAMAAIAALLLTPSLGLRDVCVDLAGIGGNDERRRMNLGLLILNLMAGACGGKTRVEAVELGCSGGGLGLGGEGEDVGGEGMRGEVERGIVRNMKHWTDTWKSMFSSRMKAEEGEKMPLLMPTFGFVKLECEEEEDQEEIRDKTNEGELADGEL